METSQVILETSENDEKFNTLVEHLVETNDDDYNHLKLAEELNELSELLIKKVTKKGGEKCPSDQMVVDEIGDVHIRLSVIVAKYGIEPVNERVLYKVNHLLERKDKYKGKL